MKKVLIGLFIPAVQERFDLFVPGHLEIRELTSLLTEGVSEICHGRYIRSGREMLVRKSPDLLLDPNKTLADYGIKDGTQLILM